MDGTQIRPKRMVYRFSLQTFVFKIKFILWFALREIEIKYFVDAQIYRTMQIIL